MRVDIILFVIIFLTCCPFLQLKTVKLLVVIRYDSFLFYNACSSLLEKPLTYFSRGPIIISTINVLLVGKDLLIDDYFMPYTKNWNCINTTLCVTIILTISLSQSQQFRRLRRNFRNVCNPLWTRGFWCLF